MWLSNGFPTSTKGDNQRETKRGRYVVFVIHNFWGDTCTFIHSTEYTECQAFCPVVRIESPPPPPQARMFPPLGTWGEPHSLAGYGVGGLNSEEGTDTLCILHMIPQRYIHKAATPTLISFSVDTHTQRQIMIVLVSFLDVYLSYSLRLVLYL